MAETTTSRRAVIAGQAFTLTSRDIVRRLRKVDPEPIASHFVVVEGRRFPPKQVISAVTGLDRADFTTHQARRTLRGLGFVAGRRGTAPGARSQPTESSRLAEHLQTLVGQWVATKDDDVLHAADTPDELVGWLTRHGQRADSMFRVPEDERAASGLAPL